MDQNKNNSLSEKDIALDLITSSKATITTLAKVLTETTNSELRDTLKGQLTACVNSHYRLSDIAVNKGWYNANQDPQQQLQKELSSIGSITQ
ncbi:MULTISPECIES: spore coat protein [Clostridium]|uniref:Coat F domain-containing protein n=2 Tax=Clostridium TaxID=1485 RepID=A0A1S8PKJ1_CLOBE|nr:MULTISPECIES: spore coat protein [Clostridium]MBN7573478.1 spore coat protein [Clostridium beijerinckii]MBN7579085.1 spore coat protein [Clostridium beijerinckii]MBN7583521.1 spore coat protein [Clostridium beijerinckii]MBO0519806.1 spore coat protein [Clostridium beijerinckii]MZK51231.1 spore coat protein [Clostridium beijerinckii]